MKRRNLWAILETFNVGIGVKVISSDGKKYRSLDCTLKDSHKNILKCLGIQENIFCWNE
jgi:hypothetical protein